MLRSISPVVEKLPCSRNGEMRDSVASIGRSSDSAPIRTGIPSSTWASMDSVSGTSTISSSKSPSLNSVALGVASMPTSAFLRPTRPATGARITVFDRAFLRSSSVARACSTRAALCRAWARTPSSWASWVSRSTAGTRSSAASARVRLIRASSSATRASDCAAVASASRTSASAWRSRSRSAPSSSRISGWPRVTVSPLRTSTATIGASISGRIATWLTARTTPLTSSVSGSAPERACTASTGGGPEPMLPRSCPPPGPWPWAATWDEPRSPEHATANIASAVSRRATNSVTSHRAGRGPATGRSWDLTLRIARIRSDLPEGWKRTGPSGVVRLMAQGRCQGADAM